MLSLSPSYIPEHEVIFAIETRSATTAALSKSQPHALISFTTRRADSIAPCIHPFHRDVCSPAKKTRPSLRAFTGIQLSSPGANEVRPAKLSET